MIPLNAQIWGLAAKSARPLAETLLYDGGEHVHDIESLRRAVADQRIELSPNQLASMEFFEDLAERLAVFSWV